MTTRRKPLSSRQEPLLAPSDLLGMELKPTQNMFPALMSEKYNGVRGTSLKWSHDKPCNWVSRRMEPVNMADHIRHMFAGILEYAEENSVVLDGEFYSRTLNKVGKTVSALAGTRPCPDDLVFMCFYEIPYSIWNDPTGGNVPMQELLSQPIPGLKRYEAVPQWMVHSWKEFETVVEAHRSKPVEGFMYLDPKAHYIHGKRTANQAILLKYKYYSDPIDAKIFSVVPMKAMSDGILPRSRNAVGRLKKLHGQDFQEETAIGGTLWAQLKDGSTVKLPFPKGCKHPERAKYLQEFGKGDATWDLKGRWVQFRRLSIEDGEGAVSVKEVEFRD